MKKITLIALFLFGTTFASYANTGLEIATIVQNTEASVLDNNLNASTVDNTISSDDSALNSKNKKKKKKFKDRSIAGKVLIIGGIAVFAVLCILYGTVSIG